MNLASEVLFQSSPNAYMVLDRDLRYIDVNHAYEQLTGLPRAQLLGRGLFEVFPGQTDAEGRPEANVVEASLRRALATGERDVLALVPYTLPTETPAGPVMELRYWSATHTPLRDEAGQVVAVLQHATDVTEVQRLREALRDARGAGPTNEQLQEGVFSRAAAVQRENERLSARMKFITDLFDQAPGFMAVLRGPDLVFELANHAYEALTGRQGFLGRTLREVLPEIEGQGFFELLEQVRLTARPFVGRGMPVVMDQDRRAYVDFIYQPIVDATGQVEAIFVQGADVTERHTALEALRESEGRFRTIANLVPQMVWSTRPDGFHDYYNQRWYDFTGMPEGSTDGEAWSGMFHADDQARAWDAWRHSLATGEPYEIEYRLRDRNGQYRWVLGRALPVRDDTGRIVRWMGTCTDIHEQRLAQDMLERSRQALQAADQQKDQFLAMLAHELRNPLAPIATAAQLLKMAPGREDTVRQAADIIDRQVLHMRNLVEDLMDVSRVTRGQAHLQRAPTRLRSVVAAAVEQVLPLVERREHRLQVHDHAPGLELYADAMRLTQVVANLLANSAKYTPPGGQIHVDIEQHDLHAVVRVRDNGNGMPPELVDRVFELFTQAQPTPDRGEGGLGIGLALARSLAQLHGGSLRAASPGPGLGSTFELRLPRVPVPDDVAAVGASS